MNSVTEKEKKLIFALTKLKNLNLKNPDLKKNIENMSSQKKKLEIEKQDQRKQIELSEKIDELNQETDSLLEEIDKWEM